MLNLDVAHPRQIRDVIKVMGIDVGCKLAYKEP